MVLAVDRAGLVGSDGETHHGCFDALFLSELPGMSTAQKTKSTREAIFSASASAAKTTSFFASSGMGMSSAQRPATASSYGLPALRELAAMTVSRNQG